MDDIKIGSNRSFGIVFFVVFLIIAFYPIVNDGTLRVWALIISLVFIGLGLINSRILTPLNKIWFKFGIFLGKIVSPTVMGLIFFLVLTPTGIFMRIIKKNFLNLKFDDSKSYWIKKDGLKSKMKNQF
jgi:hypothetical protein